MSHSGYGSKSYGKGTTKSSGYGKTTKAGYGKKAKQGKTKAVTEGTAGQPVHLRPELQREASSHEAIVSGTAKPYRAGPRKLSDCDLQEIDNLRRCMLEASECAEYKKANEYKEKMHHLMGDYKKSRLHRTLAEQQAENEEFEERKQETIKDFNCAWDKCECDFAKERDHFFRKLDAKHCEQMNHLIHRQENTTFHLKYPVLHNWRRAQQIRLARSERFCEAQELKVELDKIEAEALRQAKKDREDKCQSEREQLAEQQRSEKIHQLGGFDREEKNLKKRREKQTAQLYATFKASKQALDHDHTMDVHVVKNRVANMDSPRAGSGSKQYKTYKTHSSKSHKTHSSKVSKASSHHSAHS